MNLGSPDSDDGQRHSNRYNGRQLILRIRTLSKTAGFPLLAKFLTDSGAPQGGATARTTFVLGDYAESNGHGLVRASNTSYWLETNSDTVCIPDGAKAYLKLAPDIAVDVKCPGNSAWKWRQGRPVALLRRQSRPHPRPGHRLRSGFEPARHSEDSACT